MAMATLVGPTMSNRNDVAQADEPNRTVCRQFELALMRVPSARLVWEQSLTVAKPAATSDCRWNRCGEKNHSNYAKYELL